MTVRANEHPTRCHCQLMTLIRTSRQQNKNYGRKFLCCRKDYKDPKKCRFFLWLDQAHGPSPKKTHPNGITINQNVPTTMGGKSNIVSQIQMGNDHNNTNSRSPQKQSTLDTYFGLSGSTRSPPATTMQQQQQQQKQQGTTWINQMAQQATINTPVCAVHRVECVLRTVKKQGRNMGRKYYSCPGEFKCFFSFQSDWENRMRQPGATRIVNARVDQNLTVDDIVAPANEITIDIECELTGTDKYNKKVIVSKIPFGRLGYRLKQLLNMLDGDEKKKNWIIPYLRYDQFKDECFKIDKRIRVREIPKSLIDLIDRYELVNEEKLTEEDVDMTSMPMALYDILKPFQKKGTLYGIKRKGRFLLADEMGLGKTLQAMCVGTYYRNEWPMLIIAPSSLCGNWSAEIEKWLRYDIHPDNIIMLNSSKVKIPVGDKTNMIFIISYTLAVNRIHELKSIGFGVIICDESHKLKNHETQRSKALIPLIKSAKRKILITGTPVLSRPKELYTTLDILLGSSPGWMSFWDYAGHYCDRTVQQFGVDNKGASNLKELNFLLKSTIMIRRLKIDVLTDMPPKLRKQVRVDITPAMQDKIKVIMDANKELVEMLKSSERQEDIDDAHFKKNKDYMTLFKLTGMAKLPAIKQYIINELNSHQDKFIFFGYHRKVLDAAEKVVGDYFNRNAQHTGNRGWIRIDGNTPKTKRLNLVKRFRETHECRAAILSINACNVGLTFSPQCFRIIFGELYFTPGSLQQAEDRIHRINQPNPCIIHYILGRKTLDTKLWPMILRKLNILSQSLEGNHLQNVEDWNKKEKWGQTGIELEQLERVAPVLPVEEAPVQLTLDKVETMFAENVKHIEDHQPMLAMSRSERLISIQKTLLIDQWDELPPSVRHFPRLLAKRQEQTIEFLDSDDEEEQTHPATLSHHVSFESMVVKHDRPLRTPSPEKSRQLKKTNPNQDVYTAPSPIEVTFEEDNEDEIFRVPTPPSRLPNWWASMRAKLERDLQPKPTSPQQVPLSNWLS